jgi:hypothetical protein
MRNGGFQAFSGFPSTCSSHLRMACRTGTQCASLSQGVYEAAGRRYVLVWKMLNEVMIVALVPQGCSVLTAQRLVGAVAQLLLIYCKATPAVTMDKIFRKYVQVRVCLVPIDNRAPSSCATLVLNS